MKIGIKKILSFGVFTFYFFSFFCGKSIGAEPTFYQKLNQLGISAETLIKQSTLSRYELTRLLNAVQCQDCILPNSSTREHFNESFWSEFTVLPGKDFRDIPYLSGNFQGRNYYYCVASVGENDTMRGYPLATSNICAGRFCGERNVSKGEFFQTLTNLLIDKVKNNYSASRKNIKTWLDKREKKSYEYRVFTTEELAIINTKTGTEKITTRPEFTAYLKYCMFNPYECGFQTFGSIGKGVWPLSESNILIQEGVISAQDVHHLSSAITPKEALEKLTLLYDLHTKCEIDGDYDCDGIPNHEDNCPYTYNPSQNDLDGYGIGDVCDDDIDGDGLKNPVGLVDDTGNINYGLLKSQKAEDPTPLGEQKGENFYTIKVNSLSNSFPALAKFEIISQEAPLSVDRDFGDLATGKGVTTQHIYTSEGLKTITAKITSKEGQSFLLSQQLKIGTTQDSAYALNINILDLNSQTKTAKFQAEIQGKFDSFERGNTANGTTQKLSSLSPFTTPLEIGKRNNITLKGYTQGKLVAVASLDILDQNGNFFSFSPKYTPLLKTVNSKISTSLLLNNLSLNAIETVKRDFGDGTNFSDKKLANTHNYSEAGAKILIQKIRLKNGQELISTSSLTITNPKELGNQAFNLIIEKNSGKYQLSLEALGSETPKIGLKSFLNGKQEFFSAQAPLSSYHPFLSNINQQGIIKIKNKILTENSTLFENEGIVFLSGNSTKIEFNTNQLFSGLKCDLDQDGIPDLYDDDIDGDGVKNLLGMIKYERADCQLIVGDNVDIKLYNQHFGVCSLDNCPLTSNSNQNDLNLNGIGDSCEKTSSCGDGKIDPGENCLNCPIDVGICTAFCGNGKIEPAETCTNCPQDIKICKETSCGNGKIDAQAGEQCDNGSNNGKDGICSLTCSLIDPNKPFCGNGIIDNGEDCNSCPQDLKNICIDNGKKECRNGKIDEGETCLNCPIDVGICTAFCGNGKIEPAETCTNCPQDIKICKETSCGNGKIDAQAGEQCDNGSNNGKDGICSLTCSLIDPNKPFCGNGKIDLKEDCLNCPQDLKNICVDIGNKSSCGDGKIDPGENCLNCPQDVPICDQDEDGCPDVSDPCVSIPGTNGSCCPEIPTLCEGEDCPLVKPICNQCPCHFADYSNSLQKDDEVRARLRDQKLNVHYNYSPFTALRNRLSFE